MINISDTINSTALKSKNRIALHDDYIQDGLMHCNNCHTPKQKLIKLNDNSKLVYMMCKCMTDQYDQDAMTEKKRKRDMRIEHNKKICFVSDTMLNITFENADDTPYTKAMKRYADNFDTMDKGILMYGNVGRGKTYLSVCIANKLLDRCYSVRFDSLPRIVNSSGMNDKKVYIDELCKSSLLILDDLGAERDTSYSSEVVNNLIDTRYNTRLPMIVTTNLTLKQMTNAPDITYRRIYERILEVCHPIEIKGDNRRRVDNDEYDKMQKFLFEDIESEMEEI